MRKRLYEPRFWIVQSLLILVTLFHGLVEGEEAGSIHGFLEGARILPVQLYIVPILLAAYWYGIEGGVMTALLGLLLSIPNLLLWHSSNFAWLGEIAANSVALAVGLSVGVAAERALAARAANISLEQRLAVLQHLSTAIGHSGDARGVVASVLNEMLRVPGLDAVVFAPAPDFEFGDDLSAGDPSLASHLRRLIDSPRQHETIRESVLVESVQGDQAAYGLLGAGFSRRGPGDSDSEFLANVAHGLASAIDNASLRERQTEELQRYAAGVTRAQEAERRRIARELHDETAQSMVMLVRGLGRLAEKSSKSRPAELNSLRDEALAVVDSLRRTSWALRPPLLDELGLIPALESLLKRAPTGRCKAELRVVGEEERLDAELELTLFRVTQEALTNVVRHSAAHRAVVRVEYDSDRVRLEVSDDGSGFDPSEPTRSDSLGLIGMRERANIVGGTLTISSQPGSGTLVKLEAPIAHGPAGALGASGNLEAEDEIQVFTRRGE